MSCCASFAPLFLYNASVQVALDHSARQCRQPLSLGAQHSSKHPSSKASQPRSLQEPSWSSPITPGLRIPLHIPTATSAQPEPHSLTTGTEQPLPHLPIPCHHHKALEP